jgi:hypothetical protein
LHSLGIAAETGVDRAGGDDLTVREGRVNVATHEDEAHAEGVQEPVRIA